MAKFKKGNSGNPSGRKAGSLNRNTQIAREILGQNAVALCNKVVELALNGDTQALRVCIERLIPRINSSTVELSIPKKDLTSTEALTKFSEQIIKGLANQSLTLEEGKILSDIVKNIRTEAGRLIFQQTFSDLSENEKIEQISVLPNNMKLKLFGEVAKRIKAERDKKISQ